MSNFLNKNNLILFQGDSVTDCNRDRNDLYNLGPGYPKKIASYLNTFYGDLNLKFINKGCGGDRTLEMMKRWQADCLDLKPAVVSILIGINDTWRRYDNNDATSAADYEKRYRGMLKQVKDIGAEIILMEPFVFPFDDKKSWREDLDPKIQIARNLAREFNAKLIPLDGLFAAEITNKDMHEFSLDGVHPTDTGHAFIAEAWLKYVLKSTH